MRFTTHMCSKLEKKNYSNVWQTTQRCSKLDFYLYETCPESRYIMAMTLRAPAAREAFLNRSVTIGQWGLSTMGPSNNSKKWALLVGTSGLIGWFCSNFRIYEAFTQTFCRAYARYIMTMTLRAPDAREAFPNPLPLKHSPLTPKPHTLNPQPSTLNPKTYTLNHNLDPLNPQPSTLNPQTGLPEPLRPLPPASQHLPPLRLLPRPLAHLLLLPLTRHPHTRHPRRRRRQDERRGGKSPTPNPKP